VPGETIAGSSFATAPGGKGANQAVAAARLGAATAMVGCVGEDDFGVRLVAGLRADGIDVSAVRAVPGPTGVALIVVDEDGRNGIVVVPGANGAAGPAEVQRAEPLLAAARIVALQLETPIETVARAAARARALGKTVVLNPAPARPLPPDLLAAADLLVPNEVEAAMLSGRPAGTPAEAIDAARVLRERGARDVIVTLGDRGVVAVTAAGARHFAARVVRAVDTTAAGDTFIGGLCAALANGHALEDAIGWAQAAAAISVTRPGAQPSIPWAREVVV
jgi:ribokinase